ncbi:hypothetical protein IWGMT90018_16490 [Mycobacterium kiyosense]|nr:hypothetical protein IWGMT90018_16490 [Mycobacterium kiyosense]
MLVAGLGDRALRTRAWLGAGVLGSGFEFDRGAQLGDGGYRGQLGVVLIGAVGGAFGNDPDLIQREPAVAQTGHAARELLRAMGHRGDAFRVARGHAGAPGHQRRDRACAGGPPQFVTVDLGDDLHDPPIDRIALTGQLRQLLEQPLQPLTRRNRPRLNGARGHNNIQAATTDNPVKDRFN